MSIAATQSHAAATTPAGTCYKVLMWEEGALSPAELDAWQTARRDLLARMRDAGIKGARGTLARLGAELRELSARAIAVPLDTCARASLSLTRVGALAAKLQRADEVLAYRLTGEEGPDHNKRFFVEVTLNGKSVGQGSGRSKKEAEQMSAKAAIELLNK